MQDAGSNEFHVIMQLNRDATVSVIQTTTDRLENWISGLKKTTVN